MFDWYILNLPRRKDRRVLSIANAVRLNVPMESVHFWQAQDNADYPDADAILQAIIDDGFTEFEGHTSNSVNLGINCHDGIIFATAGLTFCPDYYWYCEVVEHLQLYSAAEGESFKFLQIGHVDFARGTTPPIAEGSLICKGVNSYDNFARIYSTEGAQLTLQRILENPSLYMQCGPNQVLKTDYYNFLGQDKYWQPEGAFSTALTFVRDMPNTWLGSDTVDIPIYRDGFAKIFEKDKEIQELS